MGEQADRYYVHDPPTKKRRISSIPPSPVKSSNSVRNNPTMLPPPVTSLPPDLTASRDNSGMPPTPTANFSFERDDSIGSLFGTLSEYDEDFIASLLALDDDVSNHVDEHKTKIPVPDTAVSSPLLPPSKTMQNRKRPDANMLV